MIRMDDTKSDTSFDSDVCNTDDVLNKSYELIEKSSDLYYTQSEGNESESNYQDSIFLSFELRASDDIVEENTNRNKVLNVCVYTNKMLIIFHELLLFRICKFNFEYPL